MSLDLHKLSRTAIVVGASYEWQVRVLSMSARARAGDGIPFVGEFQQAARSLDASADHGAELQAMIANSPTRQADMLEYLERAAMQSVTGVREIGAQEWQRVKLVPPDREDLARGWLSVAALDPDVLSAVGNAALQAAKEGADVAASFPAEV